MTNINLSSERKGISKGEMLLLMPLALYYAIVAMLFWIVGMAVEPIICGFIAGQNYMDDTVMNKFCSYGGRKRGKS